MSVSAKPDALKGQIMIGTDSIIDLSHWNTITDFKAVKDSGVQAIIHKASQGLGIDPAYAPRHFVNGCAIGWAAYHFGVRGHSPVEQADHFIRTAATDLLALDWEWNGADTMTLKQAEKFVTRIQSVMGQWPLLYTSAAFLATIPRLVGPALLNCDLWLTGFTESPVIPQQWATKGFRIWQHGIAACPGIVGKVDRNTFNGTAEELAAYFDLAA